MSKIINSLLITLLSVSSMLIVMVTATTPVLAECTQSGLSIPKCTDIKNDGSTTDLSKNPIILWINFFINLLAVTILAGGAVMMAWAGIQYMSARDNAQAVQAAKQKIWNVILGLLAFFFLYAFIQWIIPGGIL